MKDDYLSRVQNFNPVRDPKVIQKQIERHNARVESGKYIAPWNCSREEESGKYIALGA